MNTRNQSQNQQPKQQPAQASSKACAGLALLVLVLMACAGCDAPQEQREWGAREGGLNLSAKATETPRLEERSGGLNLSK